MIHNSTFLNSLANLIKKNNTCKPLQHTYVLRFLDLLTIEWFKVQKLAVSVGAGFARPMMIAVGADRCGGPN